MGTARDFFISYTGANRVWAEWIAAQLEEAGWSTWYQAADFRPGNDFVHEMHEAVSSAGRTIALLSPAYLRSRFGEAEWRAVFARDPSGELGLLIPVRVQPCDPPGLLAGRVYVDLVGDLPLAVAEAAAYLEETGEDPATYVALVRRRSRELFAEPDATAGPDERRVASVWTLSLDRVHADAPAAEQLLNLLAFLAPQLPRDLVPARPGVLPGPLAEAAADRLVYNRLLQAAGRYALISLEPAAIGMHRLVQAVVQARLDPAAEKRWVTAAVALIGDLFPEESWETEFWPECERLLPQVLAVAGHAERVGAGAGQAGWLLDRTAAHLRARGQLGPTEELARRALRLTTRAVGADHPETAERHNELGAVLGALGRLDEAVAEFERALAITVAAVGPDHPDVGIARNNLGTMLGTLGRLAEAHDQFEQALAITVAALGPDHPDVGIRRNNVGLVLRDLGRLDEARDQFEQALAISRPVLGDDHPTIGAWHNNLGTVLAALDQPAEARAHYERALAVSAATLGPDHPTVGILHNNLGTALRDLGRLAEAQRELERGLAISVPALGPGHPNVGIVRDNLGTVLALLGRLDEAGDQFDRALAIGLDTLGADHPTTALWRSHLAGLLQERGRTDQARDQFAQALTVSAATLGADHPTTRSIRAQLAAVTPADPPR